MLSTILIIDAVLFIIIALWVAVIKITGDNDQKGGVGFAAFFLAITAIMITITIAIIDFFINLIWS